MKTFNLSATFGDSSTTYPIQSRTRIGAIIAAAKIVDTHKTDKRFAEGNIVLRDGGKVIMEVTNDKEVYLLNSFKQ